MIKGLDKRMVSFYRRHVKPYSSRFDDDFDEVLYQQEKRFEQDARAFRNQFGSCISAHASVTTAPHSGETLWLFNREVNRLAVVPALRPYSSRQADAPWIHRICLNHFTFPSISEAALFRLGVKKKTYRAPAWRLELSAMADELPQLAPWLAAWALAKAKGHEVQEKPPVAIEMWPDGMYAWTETALRIHDSWSQRNGGPKIPLRRVAE